MILNRQKTSQLADGPKSRIFNQHCSRNEPQRDFRFFEFHAKRSDPRPNSLLPRGLKGKPAFWHSSSTHPSLRGHPNHVPVTWRRPNKTGPRKPGAPELACGHLCKRAWQMSDRIRADRIAVVLDHLSIALSDNNEEVHSLFALPLKLDTPTGRQCISSHDQLTGPVPPALRQVQIPRSYPGRSQLHLRQLSQQPRDLRDL